MGNPMNIKPLIALSAVFAHLLLTRQLAYGQNQGPSPTEKLANNAEEEAPAASHPRTPWSLHWQMTYNLQWHGTFPSPYSGPNSFQSRNEGHGTSTTTFFAGRRLWSGADGYLNVEAAGGQGLSGVFGLMSPPTGDSYRVGDPSLRVVLARAYVRQTWDLGGSPQPVDDDQNQVAGALSSRRVDLLVGKFCLTDFLDHNTYAGDARTQFNSWSLWANAAWDYPADTRGYTWGLIVQLVRDRWVLRLASAMEPTEANGMSLDDHVREAHGDALELEHRHTLGAREGSARLLVYENHADMGSYREALQASPQVPDVTSTRLAGRTKLGVLFNVEQGLTDQVGFFFRAGWNAGKTESWAFTEVDRTLALGVSTNGAAWKRPHDNLGVGLAVNGLSEDHRAYLAAGGLGFMLGDGQLAYAPERLVDVYHSWRVCSHTFLSGEIHHFVNPGSNADRGPVTVYGFRFHLEI